MENEEEGLQTGWGDAQLLRRSAFKPSPRSCTPSATLRICMVTTETEHQEPRQLAVSQAGCVSLLRDLTPAWVCRSQHPAATAGPRGGQKDKASAPD